MVSFIDRPETRMVRSGKRMKDEQGTLLDGDTSRWTAHAARLRARASCGSSSVASSSGVLHPALDDAMRFVGGREHRYGPLFERQLERSGPTRMRHGVVVSHKRHVHAAFGESCAHLQIRHRMVEPPAKRPYTITSLEPRRGARIERELQVRICPSARDDSMTVSPSGT